MFDKWTAKMRGAEDSEAMLMSGRAKKLMEVACNWVFWVGHPLVELSAFILDLVISFPLACEALHLRQYVVSRLC